MASSSFILVCVFTGECGVCATHTLPSFPAYVVARITEALVSGCHLRDREAMPSPRGIVGMYPLGPRGPRLPHQAPAAHRSCRFLSRRILCGTSPELGGRGPWGALGICFRLSQALPKGLLVLGRAVKHLPLQGNVCSWVKKAGLVITHFLSRGTALSRSRWPDHFATDASRGRGRRGVASLVSPE